MIVQQLEPKFWIDWDNFYLSKPEKVVFTSLQVPSSVKWSSYNFRVTEIYKRNKAIDKVVKTFIRNMKWNKNSLSQSPLKQR